MSVKWTEDLSVGVDLIDDQHKMMFEKASELFEAGKERRAQEYIEPLIEFLDEYTKKHFADEEDYMEKINYPEIDTQKRMHAHFINQLAKLKSDFKESGGNILVILNANKMILNWLVEHIRHTDKKIGEYAKTL